MSEKTIFELPVLWSRVADSVRFWGAHPALSQRVPELAAEIGTVTGDETSCIIPIRHDLSVKVMRDWLAHEFGSSYDLYGICYDGGVGVKRANLYPHALRFRFPHFDDKLLFALRWL